MGKKGKPLEMPPAIIDYDLLATLSAAAVDEFFRGFPKLSPATERGIATKLKAARRRHAAAATAVPVPVPAQAPPAPPAPQQPGQLPADHAHADALPFARLVPRKQD